MILGKTMPTKALFCVSGLTPQILTETLYALCVAQSPAWVPDCVHVLTTGTGRGLMLDKLLTPSTGQFHQFCAQYQLAGRIQFDERCIHVVRGEDQQVLADIVTLADNAALGTAVNRHIEQLIAQYDEVHVSIAGGRKTMSYYAGNAMTLHARAQDRISHVLVSEPFESVPTFFFPPREPCVLTTRDGSQVNTRDARVLLADLPFLRLREFLPPSLNSVWLDFDHSTFTVYTGAGTVKLQPILFAVFAWFAWVKKMHLGDEGGLNPCHELYSTEYPAFIQHVCMGVSHGFERSRQRTNADLSNVEALQAMLTQKCSLIRKQFKAQLGSVAAASYDLICVRKTSKGVIIRELATDANCIELNALTSWRDIALPSAVAAPLAPARPPRSV
jgi:CRISPR-associated protein (TIGR02584 family)